MTDTTRSLEIAEQIIAPMKSHGMNPDRYDLDAIADQLLGRDISDDLFWVTIFRNVRIGPSARCYRTRDQAILHELVVPIADSYADPAGYDLEGIAGQVLGGRGEGYACKVAPEIFWLIAAAYKREDS